MLRRGVEFKVFLDVTAVTLNAHASDATIIITFDSQANVIHVHKYCTKWKTFRFALPTWNLFSQENISRTWSQLSVGQGFGKVLVLAKSRNRFRFIAVHGFYTFILFQVCYVTYHPIASISFKLQWNFSISYQRPLVIENGLNIRLNKDVVHDSCIHALLVSRIAVSVPGSMYLCRRIQTSLLAPYYSQVNCI